MCDFHDHHDLAPLADDEWVLDTPVVRSFIAEVRHGIGHAASPAVGDCYRLLPPDNDVHRVRTTSADTSVSIHLLASDTGCIRRHTYDEHSGEAREFRSGYVNAECEGGPIVAAVDRAS